MSETATLDGKQTRAVMILAEHPAHELQDRPLPVLDELERRGIVERTKYRDFHNERWWYCFETKLTALGWEVAAKLPGKPRKTRKSSY